MKYPKEYLDEIKTRLKVSTVVSKSVALKKRGKEYVGLSPFKTEKTPSFTVNDEKEFYHCFATSEHGNIFDFVMKTQNFKFGAQFKGYLSNNAWLDFARHANAMAQRLAEGLLRTPGISLAHPTEVNEVFAHLPKSLAETLAAAGAVFYPWVCPGMSSQAQVYRFVTSWHTTEAEVDAFLHLVAIADDQRWRE